MRVGVISDTHVWRLDDIPSPVLVALAGVDLIVHAGDFIEMAVLDGLRQLGEVKAVHGNMDSAVLKAMLPHSELFEVNGKTVGLMHGWGGPWGIASRVRARFGDVDIVIFGHSHEPYNEVVRGSLMFNPGRARESFGILTIDQEIKGEIIKI